MIEIVDIRARRSLVRKYLGKDVGKPLSDITVQIITPTDSELCKKIEGIEKRLEHTGSICSSCNIKRRYTPSEIQSAEMFTLVARSMFEPAGEEVGTTYDESKTCRGCFGGSRVVPPLVLDLRKAPKKRPLARTIADEWIVAESLAQAMVNANITGCELRPVRHKTHTEDEAVDFAKIPTGRKLLEQFKKTRLATWKFCFWLNEPKNDKLVRQADQEWRDYLQLREQRKRTPYPRWYELVVTSNPVRIVEPSMWGNSLFDPDDKGEYKCSHAGRRDHVAGLNLVSEAHIARKDWDHSDICRSVQLQGYRVGLLRPSPILFMSPKLKHVLDEYAKGSFCFEVAYLKPS